MLALLLLAACLDETALVTSTCSLGVPVLSTTEAAPGDQVTVTVAPLTAAWDTAITVGPARATVVDLAREGCDTCDTCRATEGCSQCGECSACETDCATCVETVTFLVPEVAAGTWPVEIVNEFGRSERVNLTVTASGDTGDTGDTGPADTGDTADTADTSDTSDTSDSGDTADTATSTP